MPYSSASREAPEDKFRPSLTREAAGIPRPDGVTPSLEDKWLDGIPRPDGMTPSLQLSVVDFPRILPGNVSKGSQKRPKNSSRYGINHINHSRPLMTLPTDEVLKKHINKLGALFKPKRQQTKLKPMNLNETAPPWNNRHSVADSKDNRDRHERFRQYFSTPTHPAGPQEKGKVTIVDTFLSTAPHTIGDCSVMDTYPEGVNASYEHFSQDWFESSLATTIRPEPSANGRNSNERESSGLRSDIDGPRRQFYSIDEDMTDEDLLAVTGHKSELAVTGQRSDKKFKHDSQLLRDVLQHTPETQSDTDINIFNTGDQFEKFFAWTKQQFGSLARCWSMIDNNRNMFVTQKDFTKQLVALGYDAAELKDLWTVFDRDHTDRITFYHFDPETALDLAHFKHWAHRKFGSIGNLCKIFDGDNNGKLSLPEFTLGCEDHGLKERSVIRSIFQMWGSSKKLTEQSYLPLDTIHFLDTWECGEHLFAEPDHKGKQLFKQALLRKHKNNALAAWRKDIDRDGSMRVNYREFETAYKKIRRQSDFKGEFDIAAVWRAFDENYAGWLSLREFDENSHHELARFKDWVTAKYGGTSKLVRGIGAKQFLANGVEIYAVSSKKFYATMSKSAVFARGYDKKSSLHEALGPDGDGNINKEAVSNFFQGEEAKKRIESFFESLDIDNSGWLTEANLRFLNHWDIEQETAEFNAWKKLAETRERLVGLHHATSSDVRH